MPGSGFGASAEEVKAGRPSGHQPGERLEHDDRDHDDGRGQRQQQHTEPDVAALLRALDPAGALTVGRAAAQLLATATLEGGLALEFDLELVDALSHA